MKKEIQNTKYKIQNTKTPYTLIPLYRFSVDCRLSTNSLKAKI
jgi:hypothetical protein